MRTRSKKLCEPICGYGGKNDEILINWKCERKKRKFEIEDGKKRLKILKRVFERLNDVTVKVERNRI